MSEPPTIGKLLKIGADDIRNTLADHMKSHTAEVGMPGEAIAYVAEQAAQAMAEQLNLDVFELVFKAWAAVSELREYADPARHPPTERAVVHWGRCEITAPQAIDVSVSVAGFSLPVLRFTVDLAAEFHSLALNIQGGAIRKLTPGPATASVALRYGSVTLIPECKTPELRFEHGVEFAEGLRIA